MITKKKPKILLEAIEEELCNTQLPTSSNKDTGENNQVADERRKLNCEKGRLYSSNSKSSSPEMELKVSSVGSNSKTKYMTKDFDEWASVSRRVWKNEGIKQGKSQAIQNILEIYKEYIHKRYSEVNDCKIRNCHKCNVIRAELALMETRLYPQIQALNSQQDNSKLTLSQDVSDCIQPADCRKAKEKKK